MQLLFPPTSKKNATYRQLWKTKRFSTFVHYMMDEMFLLKKLSLVDAIKKVPKDVASAIQRLNDVRNGIAHSLFPENRRRYMAGKKEVYSGVDLFTLQGVEKLNEDCALAEDWLRTKLL